MLDLHVRYLQSTSSFESLAFPVAYEPLQPPNLTRTYIKEVSKVSKAFQRC